MHNYPKRTSLEGLEMEIFKLVSYNATPEQWKEWLRVPLEHAAARGNLDLFNKLLGAGANGGAGWRGCEGRTLLDAAAVGGNVEVMSTLLLAGAQPDVRVVSCTSKRSALYTAIMLGHEDIATRLIFAGADANFQDPVNKTGMLHKAVRDGRAQLANYLLMGGADPNSRDVDGSTPLHIIAAVSGLDGIVSDLLLKGADKDARNTLGESPLMLAAQHGHLSTATTLLASGASVNWRRTAHPKHSALDWAAEKGHVCVLQAILDRGADLDSRGSYGDTALHVAAEHDQAGAIHKLVEAGSDMKSISCDLTPFFTAAAGNSPNALLALLQRGENANARDDAGWTPLHHTCFEPTPRVVAAVDLLLRWGADETAVDFDGQTIPQMLDVAGCTASDGEIANVRLLLARAPADRAWRRRGWLVLLRARASKARPVGDTLGDCSDGNGGDASEGTGGREGEGRKVTRRENGEGASHTASESEQARCGDGGAEDGVLDLSGVVALLLALEAEGVFRTVVGYL